MNPCPCGSTKDLDACCGPILGGAPAPTAEALMRSRYTAYATGHVDHVLATYTPKAAKDVDRASTEKWSKESTWLGLEVVSADRGGPADAEGTVEFVARWREGATGAEQRHHERAHFVRGADRRWLYAEGKMVPPPPAKRVERPGRNDPCSCGSGKKFKKCCGA